MTGLLLAFEIVLLVPLFVGTWRTSLLGLSLQGVLMAWMTFRHGASPSLDAALTGIDLVLVRALLVPLLLYRTQRQRHAPRRNEVVPPTLLSWVVALALVLMAFRLADFLAPAEGEQQMLVATSASAVLLAFLVLATRTAPFSQMIGVLRLEYAIALFELGAASHHEAVGIRIGQTALVLVSVLFYRWYLVHLTDDTSPPAPAEGAVR